MLPRLRLRKTRRRLTSDSKGFSSIVGAVFAVLVMISLISTVFVWSLSQNTLYNNTVTQTRQADLDRSNEKIVANVTVSRVDSNTVSVNGNLSNDGPLSVQIVSLWVVDTNASGSTYAFKSPLSITLKPGNVTTLSGSTALNVSLNNALGDSLSCWFISGRGNTISKNPFAVANIGNTGNNTLYANVSQGIGSVAMDFGSFVYFDIDGSYPPYNLRQSEWPNGLPGFSPPFSTSNSVAFRTTLTNYDPQNRTITLTSHTALWMLFKSTNPQQPLSNWWQIVNVNSTGSITSTNAATFANVTLPWGQPTKVYFASEKDIVVDNTITLVTLGTKMVGSAAVNLMLFGTIGTSSYGQNIPFVSVYWS